MALSHPIHTRFGADDSRFVRHVEQTADGFATVGAIVERALVHIHADELVGRWQVEIARKLHGISERFFAMIEAVLNTFAQRRGYGKHQLRTKGASNCVASK